MLTFFSCFGSSSDTNTIKGAYSDPIKSPSDTIEGASSGTIEGGAYWQALPTAKLKIYTFTELMKATGNFRQDGLLYQGFFGPMFKGWVDEKTFAPAKWGCGVAMAVQRTPRSGLGRTQIYTGDLKKRLGISAGICILIKNEPELKGDRYEATFSHYFGKYGHISGQGAYCTYPKDTYLAVTGGSGIFEGVSGQVLLQLLHLSGKFRYTFSFKGIPELPAELTVPTFFPQSDAELVPSPAAKNLEPEGVIDGYQD